MLDNIKVLEPSRIYTALVMLIAVILIVIFHSPFLLWSVLGIAFLIGFYEAYKLYNTTPSKDKASFNTPNFAFWTLAILTWASVYIYESSIGAFVALVILGSYQSYTKRGRLEQMMPFIYPTIPFIFLYLLYLEYSINAVIWLLFTIGLTDSFAYVGGKMIGGKLFTNSAFCPTSPNKTKEGVLVGISVATIVGTLIGLGVCGFFSAFFLTLLTSFTSVFGDLYESFLKRQAGVKDSGKLFPGHGGILDRLDGYFFGVIVLYALLGFIRYDYLRF
ncbi:phosphatidate cytidylyltransferase [Helicobacter turcicus]|uniref:Phosphatidate cytidylyltransferase n=1 Tax=Helicobacter turcicus TaxID=2867412 RepID=A0ABS7JMB5_9HELI|nr:phosphatidate cytidylyltransferase [Helicobacter turcicus]MBX7490532.1 phosphatidate cytidylyltransferase [Helicobacter turcicus]MBX7545391.1 phosphatidate cytidylyltransferase [Helicobacter turcicus]